MLFPGKNDSILCFRHALALDEHRVKFRPFFYPGRKVKRNGKGIRDSERNRNDGGGTLDAIESLGSPGETYDYEQGVNSEDGSETDVLEVFFTGAYCDTFRWIHPTHHRHRSYCDTRGAVAISRARKAADVYRRWQNDDRGDMGWNVPWVPNLPRVEKRDEGKDGSQ